ncbi:MAG: tetratricopeptide repeat protein [Bacteroidia bacterium]|nr:tetratricopeptide repeat protein [Bacteroidia bacterium]
MRLAKLYQETKQFNKGEALFKKSLEIHKNQLGSEHPAYGAALDAMAKFYAAAGNAAEAENYRKQAEAILKK